MIELLTRLLPEVGAKVSWVVLFLVAVIGVFVLYIGLAMLATFRAPDPEQAWIRYRVFHDLLALFRRRRSR